MYVVVPLKARPIKVWAGRGDIEVGAMEQIEHVAALPMLFRHVALMPDAHQGYGMPIGGVAALEDAISPNMVGVDIGCGMRSQKTNLPVSDMTEARLKKVMGKIRKAIPVGFNHRKESLQGFMPKVESFDNMPVVKAEYNSACHQMGTLGGGNHFIEIQKDEDGFVWVMVHSGSRNIGLKVANYYNIEAKHNNRWWHSNVDPKWDLAFLPSFLGVGKHHIEEMKYCLDFALANRSHMMELIRNIFKNYFPGILWVYGCDVHHNYASLENHFGKNVWVHRKGAILAREGVRGIIPGSQGTPSYIVTGKGNPESFMSCSHGAGRKMSRKKAKATLDMEMVKKSMEGVIHSIRNKDDLDEAPQAYKDIDEVMANQTDLVEVIEKLTPLAVIKG